MKKNKRNRLEQSGWKVGTVQEFLNLSREDMALIEMKRILIREVKKLRKTNQVTQVMLAKLLKSSQSRVAKMEATQESGLSLDLICRALLVLGLDSRKIGQVLGMGEHTPIPGSDGRRMKS